ncbi:MAG TPA: hypothetical protein VI139_05785 [Gemmatimonadales bacterium]
MKLAVAAVGIAATWSIFYLWMHFQLVDEPTADYVVLAAIAFGLPLAWMVRAARRAGQSPLEAITGRSLLGAAIFTAIVAGAVFRIANGLLDFRTPRVFAATIAHVYCGRASSLTLSGAPSVPTPTNSMTVYLFPFDSCYGYQSGDTMDVVIKPGRFGRPWIAGRHVRPMADEAQQALARHRARTALAVPYPELLREAGIAGVVRFRVALDSTGRPRIGTFTVLESPNPGFSWAVRAAVGKWVPDAPRGIGTVEDTVLFTLLAPDQRDSTTACRSTPFHTVVCAPRVARIDRVIVH